MPVIGLSKPPPQSVAAPLRVGQVAPQLPELAVAQGTQVVAFLRHVGCPFAEDTVRQLRAWAAANATVAVTVVSHGGRAATETWLHAIGGLGRLRLVVDAERQLYAAWGLGYSGAGHFLGLASLAGVVRLWGRGIRNRSASGTRWQQAGMFMLREGRVVWRYEPASAQQLALPPGAAGTANP